VTRSCLVVHPGALGDVLLAGPALGHLRSLGYRTTLAVTSRLVTLFADSRLVADARDLEALALHRLFIEPPAADALAPLTEFDAVVSWLGAGDPVFCRNLRDLHRPIVIGRAQPSPGAGDHASRHLLETLAPLGPPRPELPFARLHATEAARASAGAWLADRGIRRGEAVVLQGGAGSPAKVWPGFPPLAQRMRESGVPVVALAGPADGSVVEALLAADAVAEDCVARDWPLVEVAGLLSLARAAVGNDSGPTHLAAAVGCPTVAVFGPTDPAVWAPVGLRVRALGGPSDGAPWPAVDLVDATLQTLLTGPRADAPREPVRAR
jgi:ADP-heptose:LPS heptosyltransferase